MSSNQYFYKLFTKILTFLTKNPPLNKKPLSTQNPPQTTNLLLKVHRNQKFQNCAKILQLKAGMYVRGSKP